MKDKIIISIEANEVKLSAELPEDSDIHEVGNALRALLLGATFTEKSINQILPVDEE